MELYKLHVKFDHLFHLYTERDTDIAISLVSLKHSDIVAKRVNIL